MTGIKKIVLPTDFSISAWHAIEYALVLFKDVYCEFHLLNAFAIADNKLKRQINKKLYPKQYKALKEKSEKGLKIVMNKLNDYDNPYHTFKTHAIEGNVVDVVQNFVDSKEIDLIVMGSKGVTRSRKVAYGAVAIYVMEKIINCPSIIVPETASCIRPKEIVFPTSFSDHFNENELKHMVDIAKISVANIAVLHVSEQEELDQQQLQFKNALQQLLAHVKYSFHWLSHNSVIDAVRLFSESRESDMIAFVNRKHFFFDNVFVQPLVKRLSFYSKAPLLVLHNHKPERL